LNKSFKFFTSSEVDLYDSNISSKVFFCLIVFFAKELSFQKFFSKSFFSRISSLEEISFLSKIPPNTTEVLF
tara:strand:- start:95 stop:310 length:216 start_codon:yes stop_codon:yes gene_type:complete